MYQNKTERVTNQKNKKILKSQLDSVTDGVCWGKRGIKRQPRETARFLTCTPVWVGMPFTEIRKQHFQRKDMN